MNGYDISKKQIANLRKLATFLEKLPANYAHFRMTSYAKNGEGYEYDTVSADPERIANCGSTACAVGHGPLAGIPGKPGEDWQTYEARVFGISQINRNCHIWDDLFGPDNPDDAKEAAHRIRSFLKEIA